MKTLTTTDNEQILREILFLTATKKPFSIAYSNYTTEIISEILNKKYILNTRSNKSFLAYNLIKKDIKEYTANEKPDIEKRELLYYDFNSKFFNANIKIKKVLNIDIKQAYANILFNSGYISERTFNFITSLPKQDRLICVGMLAAKKRLIHHENGEPVFFETIINELENYFFYAVEQTGLIMQKLSDIIKESFCFFWVDGIYFIQNSTEIQTVKNYLQSINLKFTEDILTDFNINIDNKNFYKITFKNSQENLKNFMLPKRDIKNIFVDAYINAIKTN